jgi:hypothetical protein
MSREQDKWDAGELDYKSERDTPRIDFEFVEHGSICLLTPMTPAANDWDEANIPKDAMRWGACSVVIEPRYAPSILEGIAADGLTVERL